MKYEQRNHWIVVRNQPKHIHAPLVKREEEEKNDTGMYNVSWMSEEEKKNSRRVQKECERN